MKYLAELLIGVGAILFAGGAGCALASQVSGLVAAAVSVALVGTVILSTGLLIFQD